MRNLLFLSLVLCLVLGIACGQKRTPQDTLLMVLDDEPKSLDPAVITDMLSIRVVAGLLEGLTVLNEK